MSIAKIGRTVQKGQSPGIEGWFIKESFLMGQF
jgi:hypothetical protein